MGRARRFLVTGFVAVVALPLSGCEDTTFCGVPILKFLFCDPNESSPPATFDTNDAPVARFSADPAAPLAGATVTFSNTSHDPDGVLPGLQAIDRTDWDLDGDGTYETPGAPAWTNRGYRDDVTRTYATAGPVNVSLRVHDWEGAEAVVTQTIQVAAAPGQPAMPTPPPSGEPKPSQPTPPPGEGKGGPVSPTNPGARAAGPPSTPAHAFVARLSLGDIAGADARKRSRSIRGVLLRGRLSGSVTPGMTRAPAALSRLLGAPLVARVDVTANTARTEQRIVAVGLATLRGRPAGRVCFVLRLTNRTGRQPVGTVRLLGGTGAGRALTGTGAVRGELRSARLARIGGTLRTTRPARSRGLPARCRGLA